MNKPLITNNTCKHVLSNNNFGIIRYLLALSILLSHISALTGYDILCPIHPTDGVKGFFIISGFLVGLSYIRSKSLPDYFFRRLKRLMPAYWSTLLFCLLIGCAATSLSLYEFFKHPETLKYIGSNFLTLNFLHPGLPGVFENYNTPAMNGSLWTTKVEIALYISVPFIFWLCNKWNKGIVVLTACILSFIYSESCLYLYNSTGSHIYDILYRQGFGQIRFFYAGTLLLFYFDSLIYRIKWLIPIAIIALLFPTSMIVRFLEPFALTTIIIAIAYLIPYISFFQKKDNIAYGIYLYHFPIIQLFIMLGIYDYNLILGIIATIFTTILTAILSWHIIEKRALKISLKKEATIQIS